MLDLISIHIPKTAGRSFLAILESVYGSDYVKHFEHKNYKVKSSAAFEEFKSEITENIKVIHGHFRYNDIRELEDFKHAKLIMWVRNPLERVISNYCFFKKRISLALNDIELQKRKNESLIQYAFKEDTRNLMSRFIDGMSLNDFYFIGVMENLNEDLIKLADMLNWGPFVIPRINTNEEFKDQLVISEEEKTIVENLNAKDIELYSKVLEFRKNNSH